MNHRFIIAFISLVIIAAVVGSVVPWEWKAIPITPIAVVETSSHTESSTPSVAPSVASSSTITLPIQILGPKSAEAADGIASATPSIIAVNESTSVLITIRITDTRVIAGGVNLQRLDASGKAIAVLGTLNDSGTNGDAVAGDKTYSIRKSFTEATATTVRLQVSWALLGALKRATSNTVNVDVWQGFRDPAGTFSLLFPPDWSIATTTNGLALSSRDRSNMLADPNEVDTPPEISLAVVSNPQRLGLRAFLGTYHGGYYTKYASMEDAYVAGRAALLISDLGVTVDLAPVYAVFIDAGPNIVIVTVNDHEGDNTAVQLDVLRRILSTIRF